MKNKTPMEDRLQEILSIMFGEDYEITTAKALIEDFRSIFFLAVHWYKWRMSLILKPWLDGECSYEEGANKLNAFLDSVSEEYNQFEKIKKEEHEKHNRDSPDRIN
jgi:hypothetical protein